MPMTRATVDIARAIFFSRVSHLAIWKTLSEVSLDAGVEVGAEDEARAVPGKLSTSLCVIGSDVRDQG